jgi:hypothetical protein
MPPELAEFEPSDWPAPDRRYFDEELPANGYRRMKWQQARRRWQYAQEKS